MDQKGFTLIELIVIIVILGILAVTAIPKYIDMKTDAEEAAASGVYGGAQGATTINFAANLIGTDPQTFITTGTTLLGAMESTPTDWSADGLTILNSAGTTTYTITIDTVESTGVKAVLSKSW
jgi:MSHA pilin protein MshA